MRVGAKDGLGSARVATAEAIEACSRNCDEVSTVATAYSLVGVTVNAAPVAMFESCAMLAPALAIPELASVVPDAWNPVQTSTFSGRVEFDRSAEG
jgi:hypothetical protein